MSFWNKGVSVHQTVYGTLIVHEPLSKCASYEFKLRFKPSICAQAIFKVAFKNNPFALENLLLKIILVSNILTEPKLPAMLS